MEILKPRYYKKIKAVPKDIEIFEVAEVKVECPNCKLQYTEHFNCDDEWHYIECDRCGTRYKYRVNW